jgi:hypothetical protein
VVVVVGVGVVVVVGVLPVALSLVVALSMRVCGNWSSDLRCQPANVHIVI